MLKKQLVQLVKDGAGIQFSDRTVAMKIGHIIETVAGQVFSSNQNNWEYLSRDIILPVSSRIAELTISLIQTKNNANGVPRIRLTGAMCECFPDDMIFYPSPQFGVHSSVDAVKISNFVFYKVTARQIEFGKTLPLDVNEVIATVCPAFHEYGDDDIINLPSGYSQQVIDMSIAAVRGEAVQPNIYKK